MSLGCSDMVTSRYMAEFTVQILDLNMHKLGVLKVLHIERKHARYQRF